jgi:hypothetical protein
MTKALKRCVVLAVLIALFMLIPVNKTVLASGPSVCWNVSSWPNVQFLCGAHDVTYSGTLTKSISGNSAGATFNPGTLADIEVLVKMQDRCQNSNGTWGAWHTIGSAGHAEFYSQSSSTGATGTYLNCFYGHQYSNTSNHNFVDAPSNLNLKKTLTSNG